MKVEHTLAGFQRSREFMASAKESKMMIADMHSIGCRNLCAGTRPERLHAESAALLASARATYQRKVGDGGTMQIVFNLSKKQSDKRGWVAAGGGLGGQFHQRERIVCQWCRRSDD